MTSIAAAVLLAPAVSAQDAEQPIPRPILRMVDALDADDLATRELATVELTREVIRPSQVTAGTISRLIRDPDLSPEQRARLIQVDRAAYPSTPRAAMGIRFAQIGGNLAGVGIAETFENFPSFNVVRANDVIMTVDGELMRSQNDLRLAILSRDPGDVMRMAIDRDDQIIYVDCELGHYADLNQAPPTGVLDLALAKRSRRLALEGTEPASAIDARKDGAGSNDPDKTSLRIPREDTWDDNARAQLARGGGDRGSTVAQQELTARERFDMTRLARQPQQVVRIGRQPVANDNAPVAEKLAKQEQSLRSRMQIFKDRLANNELTAIERMSYEQQVEMIQLQLDTLERIRAIDRQNRLP